MLIKCLKAKQTNNNCVIIRYLLVNNTYRLFLLLQIELIKSHLPYIIIQYIPVFWQKLQNAHNIYPACRISYIFKDEILLALIDWKSTSITGTQWNQNPLQRHRPWRPTIFMYLGIHGWTHFLHNFLIIRIYWHFVSFIVYLTW